MMCSTAVRENREEQARVVVVVPELFGVFAAKNTHVHGEQRDSEHA